MLDSNLDQLRYPIDHTCPIPWPAEQESRIGVDYPFTDYVEETLEEYIVQRYLETLWLPDSITCLTSFIKNLRRVRIQRDKDPQHLFEPLLLSVEAIREKYHVQLPRVIREEDGEGEIEETMMWFAYGNEIHYKGDTNAPGGSANCEVIRKEWLTKMEHREMKIQILLCFHILFLQKQNKSNQPAFDIIPSTPTKKQTETMTKTKHPAIRSSLSPRKPVFPPTESMSIEREKTKPENRVAFSRDKSTKRTPIDIEERLELLMDRLSIAQMMAKLQTPTPASMDPSQPSTSTVGASAAQVSQDPQRDWMQLFCENVVKPLFQESLPTFYDLLHSKIFPRSPFSDESDNATPSPIIRTRAQRKIKAKERAPPSPLKLHEVTKPRGALCRTASAISGSKTSGGGGIQESQVQSQLVPPHPHRSRSVSISVEEVRAKGASRGGVASSKALFRGEYEMKRSSSKSGKLFQSKATFAKVKVDDIKTRPSSSNAAAEALLRKSRSLKERRETKSKTLVFDTPIKNIFAVPVPPAFVEEWRDDDEEFVAGDEFEWSSEEDRGVNLSKQRKETQAFVVDTPVKGWNGDDR